MFSESIKDNLYDLFGVGYEYLIIYPLRLLAIHFGHFIAIKYKLR